MPIHSLTLYPPAKLLDYKNSSQTQSWAVMIDLPEDEASTGPVDRNSIASLQFTRSYYLIRPNSHLHPHPTPRLSLSLKQSVLQNDVCVFNSEIKQLQEQTTLWQGTARERGDNFPAGIVPLVAINTGREKIQTFFFSHDIRNGLTQSAVNPAPTKSPRKKAPAIHDSLTEKSSESTVRVIGRQKSSAE